MDKIFERVALESLKNSGQFTDDQRRAIAQAIQAAFQQLSVVVTVLNPSVVPHHSHTLEETNGHTHKTVP
ncbi:MAG TPA: hypothetical protein VLX61_00710 [Anaerolineales bacterium]|nr:hypothetical protein [Anaerolineales bacterium]